MKPVRAYLVLEDGSIYEGEARGAFREMACEVVFNTSMTGYLEILTDPSYAGQGVVMTYPMIGNYGVSREDFESIRLQPCAFFLHEVIGAFRQVGLVESVSITKPEIVGEGNTGPKIALMDFGVKRNIARSLASRGCEVTIYPCFATAEEIIAAKPDGLMLSNGPGDPKDCKGIIREIAKLYDYGMPTFAICLGHQLMALSQGGDTERMKYGHRGANHPVKFLEEDRSYISSQNHGYMVKAEGLPRNAEVNCVNVNDGTVEGVVYHGKPVFTVQFHPEASPGPHDTSFLFDKFIRMIEKEELQ